MGTVTDRPAVVDFDPESAAAQADILEERRWRETAETFREGGNILVNASSAGAAASSRFVATRQIRQTCGEEVAQVCSAPIALATRRVTDRSAESCRENIVPPAAESLASLWHYVANVWQNVWH